MKKKNMIVGIMSVSLLINITFSVEASESNINELSEEVTITDEKNDVDVSFDDENDDESDEVEVTLENDEEETASDESEFSDEKTDFSDDFSDNGNSSVQTNGK